MDENPDAIALRSALSILQIQRLQAIKHVQGLRRKKEDALMDPQAFARDLAEGRVQTEPQRGLLDGIRDEEEEIEGTDALTAEGDRCATSSDRPIIRLPRPQDIIRCPPINWDKYHVNGDALEAMHRMQTSMPPGHHVPSGAEAGGHTEHVVAAPYRPFVDVLHSRAQNLAPLARSPT